MFPLLALPCGEEQQGLCKKFEKAMCLIVSINKAENWSYMKDGSCRCNTYSCNIYRNCGERRSKNGSITIAMVRLDETRMANIHSRTNWTKVTDTGNDCRKQLGGKRWLMLHKKLPVEDTQRIRILKIVVAYISLQILINWA